MKQSIPKLVISIIFCELVGIIGAIFTTPAIPTWYAGLEKPIFNPPGWLFGPVWTILYALMGVSLYYIWMAEAPGKKRAYTAFFAQLGLNLLWSIIFFGAKLPIIAFVEILLLWAAIAITIYYFYRISRKAALLLAPYLAWVTFAAALNYFIASLN